jgi:hypothetical protein
LPEGALNIVTGSAARPALPRVPRGQDHGRSPVRRRPIRVAQEAANGIARHDGAGRKGRNCLADADLDRRCQCSSTRLCRTRTNSPAQPLAVERSRYDEVLERLGARFAAPGSDPTSDLDCGPLIRSTAERPRFSSRREATRLPSPPRARSLPTFAGGYYVEPHLCATCHRRRGRLR